MKGKAWEGAHMLGHPICISNACENKKNLSISVFGLCSRIMHAACAFSIQHSNPSRNRIEEVNKTLRNGRMGDDQVTNADVRQT